VTINNGDNAWMLISAALVMLMTPGLAFFYGGMVRRKNAISTITMSFISLGLIGILWVIYGYSLVFGTDFGGVIGGFDFLMLRNVGQEASAVYATTVPHLTFMAYMGMFAIITVALITGAVVERMKFAAILIFSVLWFTLVYIPIVHWIWGGGWLAKLGVLDFAGGIALHTNAGVSALSLAILLGPRKGYKEISITRPHNVPLIVLGAGILWFGWFGFNAGSALVSGGLASSAFAATNISAAAAALTWMFLSWFHHRPTASGIAIGAVAGLVAVTPAAGFITPIFGLPIGIGASLICFYMMRLRNKTRIDESLDVWACHGMVGTWGSIATGIFASIAVNPAGANGLIYTGNFIPVAKQLLAVVVVWVFSFGMTWLIGKFIDKTIGLRVSSTEEAIGLDISQHGEKAYIGEMDI
jgi:Amt family ammonium transporter